MKNNIVVSLPVCLVALTVAVPVSAHHSAFAFDTENTQIVKGTVTEWFWANPHCLLKFEIMAIQDNLEHTILAGNVIQHGIG